jgi:positive regulator of sigma E activity
VIEEIGIVKSVEGMTAVVSVPKKSACEGCTLGTCTTQEKSMEIEAWNEAGAVAGQRVRVAIKSYAYMKGAMIVYGLPAVGLVAGAIFGKELMGKVFPASDPDVLSAVFGFAACILSFVIVKIWANKAGKKTESRPVVEEILN